jgi:hypothetical protein
MHSTKRQARSTTTTTTTASATASTSHVLEFSDAGDLRCRAQAPVHVGKWKVRGLPTATATSSPTTSAATPTNSTFGKMWDWRETSPSLYHDGTIQHARYSARFSAEIHTRGCH